MYFTTTLTFAFLCFLGFAEPKWVPHVTEPNGAFLTQLIFTNTSPVESVAISVQPYQNSGEALGVKTVNLMPNASIHTTAFELFRTEAVSHLSIEATSAGQAYAAYRGMDQEGGLAHVPATSVIGRRFSFFAGNWDAVWDGAAMVNLGSEPATIEGMLLNEAGQETFRTTIGNDIAPFAKMKFVVEEVFPERPKQKLVLLSSQPMSVILMRGARGNQRYLYQTLPLESQIVAKADLIFKNGTIFTANAKEPFVESIAVADGKIIFVGPASQVEAMVTSNTEIVDLNGGMLLPGLHDVHMHPLEASSDNNHIFLNEMETNLGRHASRVRQAAARFPNTEWLVGYGHSLHSLLDSQQNPLAVLDAAESDRPVIIMEQTSHSMWVNSKALALAGIDANTPHPQGGWIVKDPTTGQPNGILLDNAGDMVMDLALASSPSVLENDYRGLLNHGLPLLARNGLTSICDARAYWKRNHHLTWKRLANEKKLTVRVNLGLWAYPQETDTTQLAMLKSLFSDKHGDLLRINQIKIYSDGITHNTTAAVLQPYLQQLFPIPDNKGLNYFTQARIAKYLRELEPHGFDFHIHTIGDRGVHESLNAIEIGGTSKGRHRLTHLEIVNPNDLARFQRLNVTADCQVAGDFSMPEHWHESEPLIGASRANPQIPIKGLIEGGARLTLSSDWNVSTANPFRGIQNAVTRVPQNISLTQAIRAYTINPAYVMRHEQRVGSLEVGKEADLVVIDKDLFKIAKTDIHKTKVLQTYLAGRLVYRR